MTSTQAPTCFAAWSWTTALAASASSSNVSPATPVGVTIVGVSLEHLADEPDLELLVAVVGAERLRRVGGKERLAGRVDHDVGRQVLEVGPRIDVRGASVRQGVWSRRAALDRAAAAVLDPQELRGALVELVVADRREVDVHQVGGDRDRLFEEEPVRQRAGADVVAREDRRLLAAVHGPLVLDRLRQVGGAAAKWP